MEDTLRGVWRVHLICCAYLLMFLMGLVDLSGWLLTFGQKDGHKLIDMLNK